MKLITLENLKNFWKDVKSYVDNGLSKKADSSHGTHVSYGTINGKAPGTPSAGTSSKVAREDHVHPVQTTVSGNAGTATKLATARTINGTSFDGTGNITTANWGAARNIQIGNSSKSVNGSSNMTWTLAEIGAAPDGHTHNYAPVVNGVQRWNSVIKCATWSRIMYLSGHSIVGHSGIINIQGTRDSVVFNATFIINTSHASKAYITQINNTNYSNFQIRAVTNSMGDTYVEVYDNANSATNATTQTLNVSYTAISGVGAGTLTKYTAFTDGTTIPTGFAEVHKITTVNGSHYSGNAATATTLQTTRTINGTSFNGSANITTANWGTARNITIGNTTKSVNGSGNVSWNLSEIGAAASSHTHNYAGSSSAGGAANSSNRMEIADTRNTNPSPSDFSNRGVTYDFKNSSAIGLSDSNFVGLMTMQQWSDLNAWSGGKTTQMAFGDSGSIYVRKGNGNGWDSWRTIAYTNSSITGNASTATKLQTTRAINGTNFDGTGNITTANWGTARNITIGNTTKSVNGSANVSWSLSEIGAASTATATTTTNGLMSKTDKSNLNEWETFKNTGGTIGGSVITGNDSNESYLPFIAKRLNLDKKLMEIHFGVTDAGAGTLMRMVNGVNGGRYDFDWQGFYPVDATDTNRALGLVDKPWGDIHLKGVSKSTNGYTKLPNGLILQWGSISETVSGLSDKITWVRYPIEFPNGVFNITHSFSCQDSNTNARIGACYCYPNSNAQFKVRWNGLDLPHVHTIANVRFSWLAIGY